jgi:hypothetical protein
MVRRVKIAMLLLFVAAVTAASAFYGYTSEVARRERARVLASGAR